MIAPDMATMLASWQPMLICLHYPAGYAIIAEQSFNYGYGDTQPVIHHYGCHAANHHPVQSADDPILSILQMPSKA